MNGNISKVGITADLEAMKRIGIGGAQIFNVDVGIPDGKTPMMSPQWKDDVQFAIHEAHRLGMDLCLHNGAGWSSSGGPWIKPEQGMQFLTWSETPFQGPGQVVIQLPQPASKEGFYRDIAIYAVRKPAAETAGGPGARIDGIRAKAAFERGDRITPSDTASPSDTVTRLSDVVLISQGQTSDGTVKWNAPEGDWILVRMGYTPTGETNHPAPVSGRGLEVDKLSRAALDTHWAGMMGPIVKSAGKLAGTTLNNCLIDSYEVGTQNWSPNFRNEFKKRRGYDPLPYLPIVSGRIIESTEVSERFLWDLRRTICDLFADNYYGYLADICHKNGLLFSTEPYGNGEFDNLQIGGLADIPMGEFWVGNGAIETTKLASSAGHIYGKQIIGAESFTADTPHARWTIDPYAMKALGDRVFSLGVNRYIFHRYAHQPWLDLKPGMTMGPWGTNLERTITWWEQGSAWMQYIARCQYLLQSGNFTADIACFTGDEGPNDLPLMKGTTIPEGYDYDGVDRVTLQKFTVKDHWLVLPSGMRYRLLMLPESRWMTVESIRKIKELVAAGAVVYGVKPSKSPSLQGYPASDGIVHRDADAIWGDATPIDGAHRYELGKVYWGKPLGVVLSSVVSRPDCVMAQGLPKSMVWLHRRLEDQNTDIYFISNQRYEPETFEVDFRVTGRQPELWNPQTGTTSPAPVYSEQNGATRVTLQLSSAESVFVVFRSKAPSAHLQEVHFSNGKPGVPDKPEIVIESARYEALDGFGGADVAAKVTELVKRGATEVEATNENFGDPTSLHAKRLHVVYMLGKERLDRSVGENETLFLTNTGNDVARPEYELIQSGSGLALRSWSGGKFTARDNSGKQVSVAAKAPETLAITGPWKLSFPPKSGAPTSALFPRLISWTDADDSGIKYFSGSATYEKEIEVPARLSGKGRSLFLDLGAVKNFAEVTLNGHALGILWKPPFLLDVSAWLKPGKNRLQVRVTNLWPNRIIGDEHYPPDEEWNGEVIKSWPDWLAQGKPRPASPRITFTTWRVFNRDSPLYPSGLIGPVSIISVGSIPIK